MPLPGVTAIVLVHDRVTYLREALDSIRAQDYAGEIRILLVDDGSTPPARERFGGDLSDVQLVRQPSRGPAIARQLGAETARTDLIAYLDDDDLWPVDSLSRRVAFLLAYPEVPVVAGDVDHFRDDIAPGPPWYRDRFLRLRTAPHRVTVDPPAGRIFPRDALVDFVLLNTPFYAQSILAWRDWFLASGGWGGAHLMFAEPFDFAYRATRTGPVGYLDAVTAHIRRGHTQMTGNLQQSRLEETRELAWWSQQLPPRERQIVRPRLARRFLVHGFTWVRQGRVAPGLALARAALPLLGRDPIGFVRQPWHRAAATSAG